MGETVDFKSNGGRASGYLARPAGGRGPGVIVVQEWWGLDDWIKEVVDVLGQQGFVALAPDLYHGESAGHTEMDKAGALMQALPPDRAAHDMSAAVDYLAGLDEVTGEGLGVVGFCMGGMLALILAANRGDKVTAAVPFYGYPPAPMEPDWSGLTASVRGHLAEHDEHFSPAGAQALQEKLQSLGKDVEFTTHPGTGHAFMAAHNALGTYDQETADAVWPGVFTFLHQKLG